MKPVCPPRTARAREPAHIATGANSRFSRLRAPAAKDTAPPPATAWPCPRLAAPAMPSRPRARHEACVSRARRDTLCRQAPFLPTWRIAEGLVAGRTGQTEVSKEKRESGAGRLRVLVGTNEHNRAPTVYQALWPVASMRHAGDSLRQQPELPLRGGAHAWAGHFS